MTSQDNNVDVPRTQAGNACDVSIVIVNYKTREHLRRCLQAISSENLLRLETIIFDNGSGDGSVEMVRQDFPWAHLIESKTNIGFAKANNLAFRQAKCDFVLLLNPDVEVKDGAINLMHQYMKDNPDVAVAGCKVLYPDGRIQMSCGYAPTIASAFFGGEFINRLFKKIFPRRDFIGACGITKDQLNCFHEVETLLGACVILRKDILEKTGGFDENMFVYFEECELFHRIRQMGGRIMYIPNASVYHHAGASISLNSIDKAVSYYQKSQEYYLRKVYGLKHIKLFRILVATSALIKAGFLTIIYPFTPRHHCASMWKKILWHFYVFRYYTGRAES